MILSVIMPGYKDKYSQDTIRDLLKNSELGDQLEIIHVWDGFYPEFEIVQDPHVRYIHLGKNRGMRGAINAGVAIARGKFFCRLDEHCCFAKGWDKELTDTCKENEIMTARRYFLDPVKWEVMKDQGYVDHERLDIMNVSDTVRKFHGKRWKERDAKQKDVPISEMTAMQGSMWIANREFFLKTVGELQTEGYGPLIQDSVEVCMKYWKAGGRLMLNKNTWFAHKHRSFARTHNNGTKENPAQQDQGYTYALEQWEDYYLNELQPKWKLLFAN
jgi:glycosyltransferase involved in cell wall biosynthesis